MGGEGREKKKYLYLLTKSNNDIKLRQYYKLYGKILNKVIKEAKRSNYNNQISNSQNRIKTTWDIIKCEKGQRKDSAKINNNEICSKTFNNYFVWIAEQITQNISNNSNIKGDNIQKSIQMMTKIDWQTFV